MKRIVAVACLLVASLAVAGLALAQTVQTAVGVGAGTAGISQVVEVTAVVEAIDAATREVTLKGPDGKSVVVTCGEEVRNFAQIKVGDQVGVKYYESLTLALDKTPEGSPSGSESASVVRAEPGQKPGGTVTREINLVAKVTAVDAAASKVTLVGPKGRSVDLKVGPEALAKLKVGDSVSATYKQALAISVSPVAK